MKYAVLLIDGRIVRLEGEKYNIYDPKFSLDGLLSSFKVNDIQYSYTDSVATSSDHALKGYCKVTLEQAYKNYEISYGDFVDEANWFDKIFEPAQIGDMFWSQQCNFYIIEEGSNAGRDFQSFYRKNDYTFKITRFDFNFGRSEAYPPFNGDLFSEEFSNAEGHLYDSEDTFAGRFYKKNFGDKVSALLQNPNTNEWGIEEMAAYMLRISWRIHWIYQENLLSIIAIKSIDYIKQALRDQYIVYVEDTTSIFNTYNTLSLIDKIVAELYRHFGYMYGDNFYTPTEFEPKDFFPELNFSEIQRLYIALSNFYTNFHFFNEDTLFPYDSAGNPVNDMGTPLTYDPDEWTEKDSDRRTIKLLNLLPAFSFALFSAELRLKILKKILDGVEVYEDRSVLFHRTLTERLYISEKEVADNSIYIEKDVIKLIESFNTTYEDANALLDFLIEVKYYDNDGLITSFERLYSIIDDKTTILGFSPDEDDNRGFLIYTLYEIWKKSRYYFYSQPAGITPNPDGTNPESYFLYDPVGRNYYAHYDDQGNIIGDGVEPIMEFSKHESDYATSEIRYSVDKKLEGEKVKVYREFDFDPDWELYLNPQGFSYLFGVGDTKEEYGMFHLYLPIQLIGYKVDEDLQTEAPQLNMSFIPTFLFYYVEEFNRLKNVNATITFILEVALEVGLFFLTSGASAAATLGHLRHLTKLRRVLNVNGALEAGVALDEILLTVRVYEGAVEIVSMTAGVASSYLQFIGTVNDDPTKRRLSYFFMAFAFASVGGAIFSRKKLIGLADELLEQTPPSILSTFPDDVLEILSEVQAKKFAKLSQTADKLADVDAEHNLGLVAKYDNLSPSLRYRFTDDFGALALENGNDWSRIDEVFENWKKLALRDIDESKLIDFLTNQNYVDTIVDFYDDDFLRAGLEAVESTKRIEFIKNFRYITTTNFNKFVTNHDLVKYWFRYFDENALRFDFMDLNNIKQLKFLEDYGNCIDDVFDTLKEGGLIKYWNKVDDAPLDALVHSNYIRRVDYLVSVKTTYLSGHWNQKMNKFIRLIDHLEGEIKTIEHMGADYRVGFSGFHLDYKITELDITPTFTTINGKQYMTGPLPISGSENPVAVLQGSRTLSNQFGIIECKPLVWGYASVKNTNPPPPYSLLLDSGNPVKAWVPKVNNGGRTSLFPDWNSNKVLNETAFARLNLARDNFVTALQAGKKSNTWEGFASDGTRIHMYIGENYISQEHAILPNITENIISSFPKK